MARGRRRGASCDVAGRLGPSGTALEVEGLAHVEIVAVLGCPEGRGYRDELLQTRSLLARKAGEDSAFDLAQFANLRARIEAKPRVYADAELWT